VQGLRQTNRKEQIALTPNNAARASNGGFQSAVAKARRTQCF
jgi:hypothetical protein